MRAAHSKVCAAEIISDSERTEFPFRQFLEDARISATDFWKLSWAGMIAGIFYAPFYSLSLRVVESLGDHDLRQGDRGAVFGEA